MRSSHWRFAFAIALAAGIVGCEEFGSDLDPTGPASMEVVTGVDEAGAVVGSDHTVTLQVLSAAGDPVQGITVELSVSGDGAVDPASGTSDASGEVTATWTLGTTAGEQTLTATAGEIDLAVTATVAPGPVSELSATPDTLSFDAVSATAEASVEAADEHGNAVEADVAWSSTDESVATVDAAGQVTATGNGEAFVVATAGAVADSIFILVDQAVATIELSTTNDTLAFVMAGAVDLEVTAVDSEGQPVASLDVSWSSSDATVIEATDTGLVIVGVGAAEVTASTDEASASATLRITPDARFALAGGQSHTCFLDIEGAAYCAGFAGWGQLGTGVTGNLHNPDMDTPTPVSGGHTFVQLVAGSNHTCAIKADGTTYCWGANYVGQIGADLADDLAAEPTAVNTSQRFKRLTATWNGTCGLTTAGDVFCWGDNAGHFGVNNDLTDASSPVLAYSGMELVDLAVGLSYGHLCATGADGETYCWGGNWGGQLGDGTFTPRDAPVQVLGETDFVTVSVGLDQTCGLDADGAAWCWGSNGGDFGFLGNGSTEDSPEPVPVSSSASYANISGSNGFNCATSHAGEVHCWGFGVYGQTGDGTLTSSNTPTTVSSGGEFVAAVGNGYSACGITTAFEAECWGYNYDGQLGMGPDGYYRATPGPTTGSYEQVAVSRSHACGLTSTGSAECWGGNGAGALGTGGVSLQETTPVAVTGGHTFVDIDVGIHFSCAVDDAGSVWCWGQNHTGQLGDGSGANSAAPVQVQSDAGLVFDEVSVATYSACAIAAGDAWCWGANESGQLGDGTTEPRMTPVQVSGGHTFARIDGESQHFCAIDDADAGWCWGHNGQGQLGDGTFDQSTAPVAVAGSMTFSDIASAPFTSCGISAADGAAYCWGEDFLGIRGDGGGVGDPVNTPVAVAGGITFQAIDMASWNNACGLDTDGNAHCWGLNYYGEAGTGGTGMHDSPAQVSGGSFQTIAAGQYTTCATTTTGDAQCWGHYGYGELGDGSSILHAAPGLVQGGVVFPTATITATVSGAVSAAFGPSLFRAPGARGTGSLDRPEEAPSLHPTEEERTAPDGVVRRH